MEAETLTTTARQRQTAPPKLVHLVRGDLDWIVMKCLAKDRARRYETANGLAADIQRHLNTEPVVARPPSKFYEFRRTVQRHKFGFAAGAALIMVLTLGVVTSTWQAVRAMRAEREQLQLRKLADRARAEESLQRQKAEAGRAKSEAVAKFLSEMLKAAGPSVARGRDATVMREILERTADRVDRELRGQPEVQGDVWMVLGSTYADIGDQERAAAMYERAAAGYRQAFGGDDRKLALALGSLGSALSWNNRISEGTNQAGLGLEMARRLGDPQTVASSLVRYALSLEAWGKGSTAAVPYLKEALAIRRSFGTNSPALGAVLSRLAVSLTNAEESVACAREAALVSAGTNDNNANGTTAANNHFMLGQQSLRVGKPDEAESELREALRLWRIIFDSKHPHRDVVFRYYIESLARQKKWAEAETEIQAEAGLAGPGTDYCVTLRAAIKVRQGRWLEAVEILSPVVDGLARGPNVNTATVLALQAATDKYREQCRRLLDKTPVGTDYAKMERTAKAALLMPPDPPDLIRAADLADAAANVQTNPDFAPWGRMTKALAEYRRGNFSSAITWSDRVIATADISLTCMAATRCIQSLAHARLGQTEQAQAALAAANEAIQAFREGGKGSDGVILENWKLKESWSLRDWLTAEVLRREAETVLSAPPPTSK